MAGRKKHKQTQTQTTSFGRPSTPMTPRAASRHFPEEDRRRASDDDDGDGEQLLPPRRRSCVRTRAARPPCSASACAAGYTIVAMHSVGPSLALDGALGRGRARVGERRLVGCGAGAPNVMMRAMGACMTESNQEWRLKLLRIWVRYLRHRWDRAHASLLTAPTDHRRPRLGFEPQQPPRSTNPLSPRRRGGVSATYPHKRERCSPSRPRPRPSED